MPSDPLADAITAWFRTSARDLPWRREGFPAWGTLVSEFMLQQTPVVRVVPRLAEWLERWPTPSALAAVPPGEAVRAWQSLGYPRRALRLHACAVAIAEEHGDVVPDDVETLLALPGIGDYTARAIAVFAYGRRHPVVDTNVRRVLARAVDGAAEPGPPRARADLAAMSALLPESLSEAAAFNAGAMELGAVVCTARAPRCDECPIRDLCRWRAEGYPEHTGPVKAKQKRFEGSDRQVRGLILAELRAAHGPVTAAEVESLWPDADQRGRALAGLLADGLATGGPEDGYLLPGS
ncbi:adenine glycosylase [Rathayibacter sp. AY1G1]|uniref:A/G-specific adenine glycosylase n=1 Tax=unclassified Rathayibacter TaxID=2609250 RepID=UPI000CE92480|nr:MULTISPECIES: A/G-specific adenine glycosylase [unclassified Rathayibacter]PPF30112.1 adenine glycosylase [Rathayibacter sp. AY1F2]PPG55090.1 adenine glycosylase [Rathayibacter sp. AY1E9]PPG61522.1 adenine glycosylase [Rathayibacter sp. AY1C5]PPG83470.1 adenine glycosylase [Rathayibacter sp. AY1E5]PPH15723.1 adenine glycosylase [Rathayibacter sp. AY1G1]